MSKISISFFSSNLEFMNLEFIALSICTLNSFFWSAYLFFEV